MGSGRLGRVVEIQLRVLLFGIINRVVASVCVCVCSHTQTVDLHPLRGVFHPPKLQPAAGCSSGAYNDAIVDFSFLRRQTKSFNLYLLLAFYPLPGPAAGEIKTKGESCFMHALHVFAKHPVCGR